MEFKIDKNANEIIARFKEAGYEAFVVGGCVRDSIMGRVPNDWDIATNALPEVSLKLFKHTIPTGLKHGTVTIMMGKQAYEVTTYRIDGEYLDMRRPSEVCFSTNILDDLSRRDFTINAMAYNNEVGLIDEFGGAKDIESKLIRCVGEADKRFNEDALRIIRAIRFSAKLGFKIEEETFTSILRNSENLRQVSVERINKELEETIRYNALSLENLNIAKISPWLFEGYILDKEDLGYADLVKEELPLFMSIKRALVFRKMDNENLGRLLKKMRYSNKEITNTVGIHHVLENKDYDKITKEKIDKKELGITIKTILNELGDVEVSKAAIYSKFIGINTNMDVCFNLFNDIIEEGQCFSVSQLDINGRDLMEHNLAKGAKIGILLDYLCSYVIRNPHCNDKNKLLELAREFNK